MHVVVICSVFSHTHNNNNSKEGTGRSFRLFSFFLGNSKPVGRRRLEQLLLFLE